MHTILFLLLHMKILQQKEKRKTSTFTPKWDVEKCIECGMCAFVCPHTVIRNFVNKDKSIGKPLIGKDEYNFSVGISNDDCTGCGLCVNVCPTHALTLEENVKPSTKLFDTNNFLVNKPLLHLSAA